MIHYESFCYILSYYKVKFLIVNQYVLTFSVNIPFQVHEKINNAVVNIGSRLANLSVINSTLMAIKRIAMRQERLSD